MLARRGFLARMGIGAAVMPAALSPIGQQAMASHAAALGAVGSMGATPPSPARAINPIARALFDQCHDLRRRRQLSRVGGFDADLLSMRLPLATMVRIQASREREVETLADSLDRKARALMGWD